MFRRKEGGNLMWIIAILSIIGIYAGGGLLVGSILGDTIATARYGWHSRKAVRKRIVAGAVIVFVSIATAIIAAVNL